LDYELNRRRDVLQRIGLERKQVGDLSVFNGAELTPKAVRFCAAPRCSHENLHRRCTGIPQTPHVFKMPASEPAPNYGTQFGCLGASVASVNGTLASSQPPIDQ